MQIGGGINFRTLQYVKNHKDPLFKILTFVKYLENVWYDEAVIFIHVGFIIPDIFQTTDESLDFSNRIFITDQTKRPSESY